MLHKTKFSYNHSKNWAKRQSPPEIFNGKQPMHFYDLALLPKVGRNSLKGENITSWLKERTTWIN